MVRKYRYAAYWTSEDQKVLRELGVDIGTEELEAFIIKDNDKYFNDIYQLMNRKGCLPLIEAVFSKKEIEEADFFLYLCNKTIGYPQPEVNFMEFMYNAANTCHECGIHGIQKTDFVLKSNPNWNRSPIGELYWVGDELFVSTSFYEQHLKQLSIQCREVKTGKKKEIAIDTVQLIIDPTSFSLDEGRFEQLLCEICGRVKYSNGNYSANFLYASEYSQEKKPIFKTKEWFGTGGMAFRGIIVSKAVYNILMREGIKKSFSPVVSQINLHEK